MRVTGGVKEWQRLTNAAITHAIRCSPPASLSVHLGNYQRLRVSIDRNFLIEGGFRVPVPESLEDWKWICRDMAGDGFHQGRRAQHSGQALAFSLPSQIPPICPISCTPSCPGTLRNVVRGHDKRPELAAPTRKLEVGNK